jgi:hypothetical protein
VSVAGTGVAVSGVAVLAVSSGGADAVSRTTAVSEDVAVSVFVAGA